MATNKSKLGKNPNLTVPVNAGHRAGLALLGLAGLMAFLSAQIVPGIEMVSQVTNLKEHLQGASLVITGEGKVDTQTLYGKSVAGIAAEAKLCQVPVVIIAGAVAGDFSEMRRYGIDAAIGIAPGPISRADSMAEARHLIADTAERAMRLILINLERQEERVND